MPEADLEITGLDEIIEKLEILANEERVEIERQALQAVDDIARPALIAATPIRPDTPKGEALRPGEPWRPYFM